MSRANLWGKDRHRSCRPSVQCKERSHYQQLFAWHPNTRDHGLLCWFIASSNWGRSTQTYFVFVDAVSWIIYEARVYAGRNADFWSGLRSLSYHEKGNIWRGFRSASLYGSTGWISKWPVRKKVFHTSVNEIAFPFWLVGFPCLKCHLWSIIIRWVWFSSVTRGDRLKWTTFVNCQQENEIR